MCREKVDVIFVYEPSPITIGLPALLLKKIKNAPILFWVQDLWPESLAATGAIRSAWILRLVEKMVHFIYHRCDLILVQSKAFVPCIEKFGIVRERIVYFPNSAGRLYQPVTLDQCAKERLLMPDGFRVMFAGNLGQAQDFETILTAAEQLKSLFRQTTTRSFMRILIVSQYFWPESFPINDLVVVWRKRDMT